jgi:hypothetical protein
VAWKPVYVTDEELADELRINGTAVDDDAQLARWATSASRAVDGHCKRQFGQVAAPEARLYTPRYSRSRGMWLVTIDDTMVTPAEVAVEQYSAGVFVVVTGSVLRPFNAVVKDRPWTELALPDTAAVGSVFGRQGSVRVTSQWGWTAVPAEVVVATMLQASRFAARRDSPYGISGSPDADSQMRLLARVDPDVAVALNDLRRKVGAR